MKKFSDYIEKAKTESIAVKIQGESTDRYE